jgi:hypothetical protein
VITGLAITAGLFSGVLAGVSIDRMVVALPAWRRVGLRSWADFSRQADLGNGRVLYPLLGLAAPACSVAAAASFHFAFDAPHDAAFPVYASAALGIARVLATARAAPHMLRAARLDEDNLMELDRAFGGFERWHSIRTIFQAAAFGACVWALLALRG